MKLCRGLLLLLSLVFFEVTYAEEPFYVTSLEVSNQTVVTNSLFSGGGIFTSKDRGATWNKQFGANYIHSLIKGADQTLYAAAYNASIQPRKVTIYFSKDDGATWTPLTWNFPAGTNLDWPVSAMNMENLPTIYIGRADGLYISNDNGQTSTKEPNVDGAVFSIVTSSDGVKYVACDKGLYVKIGTANWNKMKDQHGVDIPSTRAFFFINQRNILAGTTKGIYQSTDGGMTWSAQTLGKPIPTTEYVTSIIMADEKTFYAAVEKGINPGIYKGLYDGNVWTWSPLNLDIGAVSVLTTDNTSLYAGGENGVFILPLT